MPLYGNLLSGGGKGPGVKGDMVTMATPASNLRSFMSLPRHDPELVRTHLSGYGLPSARFYTFCFVFLSKINLLSVAWTLTCKYDKSVCYKHRDRVVNKKPLSFAE